MTGKELFDMRLKVEEKSRFPKWLHRRLPAGEVLWETHKTVERHGLHTVCQEAKCPNLLECYSKKTATFLVMGKECTRACGFCEIDFSKKPAPLDPEEPFRVAKSVEELGLSHVVITHVARDDALDGGAEHLVKVVQAIREHNREVTIETLTSDFEGNSSALDRIANARPEIFNHNLETVRRLTPQVRHKATYSRSLQVLAYMKGKQQMIKSGIMVGLGETEEEVREALKDLHTVGCDIVTIGQYLQPSRKKLSVKSFVSLEHFKEYELLGRSLGIPHVYAGPFVRSSYNAHLFIKRDNKLIEITHD